MTCRKAPRASSGFDRIGPRLANARRVVAVMSAIVGVLSSAALADDMEACTTLSFAPLEQTIPACDRLIGSGTLDEESLFRALVARAHASGFAITYHFGHDIDARALLDAQLADFDRALVIARRLHDIGKLMPEFRAALADRASVLLQLDENERAAAGYSEVIYLSDEPATFAFFGRSLAFERMGRLDLALADMTVLVWLADGGSLAANVLVRRAELHEAAGHTDMALADYRRVLTLAPDHVTARDAIDRLAAD